MNNILHSYRVRNTRIRKTENIMPPDMRRRRGFDSRYKEEALDTFDQQSATSAVNHFEDVYVLTNQQSTQNNDNMPPAARTEGSSRFESLSKWVVALVSGGEPDAEMVDVSVLEKKFREVSVQISVIWVILSCILFILFPKENMVHLPESAKNGEKLCSILMLFSLATRLSPLVLESRGDQWPQFSGAFVCALAVQSIAATSNAVMGWLPIPLMVDRMTGCYVNLFRYCEWIPLAYGMAFLTDGIDATNVKMATTFAVLQGVSTSAGMLLPLCPEVFTWLITFTVCIFLFFLIFMRLFYKVQHLRTMSVGESVDAVEQYERVRIALRLLKVCVVTWSCLVLAFCVSWFCSAMFGSGKYWNIVLEPYFDMMAKNIYLSIMLEAHERVFDDKRRAERRLEELRRMMSIIWSSSSDLLLISVCGMHGTVKTQLSPAYSKLLGCKGTLPPEAHVVEHNVMDLDDPNELNSKQHQTLSLPDSVKSFFHVTDAEKLQEMSGIKSLLLRAWNGQETEKLITHNLLRQDGTFIHCEAKITRLKDRSLIVVIRNITERFRRFEAEKKVISLVTARKKDTEANKFTRHEVKNGLLAAIGLCDGLRETVNASETVAQINQQLDLLKNDCFEKIDDLDTTLNETLDIVITEVVARDLVNGVYIPRYERLDLCDMFANEKKKSNMRFPFEFQPNPFPSTIILDPQLLQYIHRNAVTNACKYGKKGGTIRTVFTYITGKEMLEMKVINEPGPLYDEILEMGRYANELVFTPGKRLHNAENDSSTRFSSGDGAWIMRNCARSLKGNCDYDFRPTETVFSLFCPAKAIGLKEPSDNSHSKKIFPLPENTWGIAIDDSTVQRKLLQRYLSHTGVTSDKIIVKGATFNEIKYFDDFIVDLVQKNPTCLFLIIADENMDITDNGEHKTISGSLLLENIIKTLDPSLEKRLLALVRSANDSSADIAMYQARAHGFLPKAPVKKDKVEEMLAPLWVKRFGKSATKTSSFATVSSSINRTASENSMEEPINVEAELLRSIDRIDCLLKSDEEDSSLLVKELLHALKGDLMTHSANTLCLEAMDIIDMIRSAPTMDDFVIYEWKKLYALVLRILEKISNKDVPNFRIQLNRAAGAASRETGQSGSVDD